MTIFMDNPPDLLATTVADRLAASSQPLDVFWTRVSGDRDKYKASLTEIMGDLPVVVLVVRKQIFQDPNSVMADLSALLTENAETCQRALRDDFDGIVLVLLGRAELTVPQISSPVVFPSWLPGWGGRQASVTIEDLTWATEGPLNSSAASLEDLAGSLFRVEGLLVSRMKTVAATDRQSGDAFLAHLGRDGDGSYADLLAKFLESRNRTKFSGAYRPSLRDGDSLVARLWGSGQQKKPEESGPPKALSRSLGLSPDIRPPRDSFFTILRRPSDRAAPPDVRLCRNLIVVATVTCQYLTAAAHSDQYPNYPIQLIRASSVDLLAAYRDLERFFVSLP